MKLTSVTELLITTGASLACSTSDNAAEESRASPDGRRRRQRVLAASPWRDPGGGGSRHRRGCGGARPRHRQRRREPPGSARHPGTRRGRRRRRRRRRGGGGGARGRGDAVESLLRRRQKPTVEPPTVRCSRHGEQEWHGTIACKTGGGAQLHYPDAPLHAPNRCACGARLRPAAADEGGSVEPVRAGVLCTSCFVAIARKGGRAVRAPWNGGTA